MTTPEIDERSAEDPREHPPLRLRSRRSVLLPDLRPPSLEEIRWKSQHRREVRAEVVQARQRRKVEPPPPRAEEPAQLRVEVAPVVPPPLPPPPPPPPPPSLPPTPPPPPEVPPPVVDDVTPPEWLDPVAVACAAIAPDLTAPALIEPEPEPEPELEPEPVPTPAVLQALDGPLLEETADLDELDTGFDLDLEFRPVPALSREPRVAPPGSWWEPAPVEDVPEPELVPVAYPPTSFGTTPDIVAVFAEPAVEDSWDAPLQDALGDVDLTPWRPEPVAVLDDDVDVLDVEDEHEADGVVEDYNVEPPFLPERLQQPGPAPSWLAEPEPEPEPEPDERPIVSQVLVIREPAPYAPERVAVLDEPNAPTVTRLVPLPAEPAEDFDLDEAIAAAPALPDFPLWVEPRIAPVVEPSPDEHYEPLPAVPKEWAGRPAPLYWRLLRLRYVRPNGWLRALFFEGSVAAAVVLVLSGVATVWTIVVLPLVVAIIVKANDVLTGNLRRNLGSNDEADTPPEDY